MNATGYVLTAHLRERYVERFLRKKYYGHLALCHRRGGCEECKALSWDLRDEARRIRPRLDAEISGRLGEASEECAYLNNTEFMGGMYERYGYKRFKFLVHQEVLFVVLMDDGQQIVPTCIPARESVIGNIVSRPKFKKAV